MPVFIVRPLGTSINRHRIHISRFRRAAAARDDQAGFSVVELLIALTLMSFLATSLLTIITTGSDAFQNILDEKNAQSEARIAVSYITVKLRQQSSRGVVSVVPSDSQANARNVLKIEDPTGFGMGENCFIYFEAPQGGGTGRLVEKYSAAPRVGDLAGTQKIAEISDFSISYANEAETAINISVSCDAPSGKITRDVSVALRAPGAEKR